MTIDDRELEAALATLLTTSPPSLAPGVLAEVGLADRYATIDSPIGPVVVAWNGVGVSSVSAATDHATFESSHEAQTGRRAIRAERLPEALEPEPQLDHTPLALGE